MVKVNLELACQCILLGLQRADVKKKRERFYVKSGFLGSLENYGRTAHIPIWPSQLELRWLLRWTRAHHVLHPALSTRSQLFA